MQAQMCWLSVPSMPDADDWARRVTVKKKLTKNNSSMMNFHFVFDPGFYIYCYSLQEKHWTWGMRMLNIGLQTRGDIFKTTFVYISCWLIAPKSTYSTLLKILTLYYYVMMPICGGNASQESSLVLSFHSGGLMGHGNYGT